jgi:hypothetical protein
MIATEHATTLLQAVADDAHAAVFASGREGMNGTFEAVERMRLVSHHHLKGFVVVVSARITDSDFVRFRGQV